MEMARNETRVVDLEVHVIACVHQPRDPARKKSKHRQYLRGHRGIAPRKLEEPAQQPTAASSATADLESIHYGKSRSQTGHEECKSQYRGDKLDAVRKLRIDVLMVHPDGKNAEKKQESDPSDRVTEKRASNLARNHRVPRDVNRQQPVVHNRVAGVPKKRAAQHRSRAWKQAERPGQQ